MDKNTIFTGQPVFNQILDFINRSDFDSLVKEHKGDRYCKKFMSYDHLVTMLYSAFFQCNSLREITTGMQANYNKLHHVGLKQLPARSTLSEANERRPEAIFSGLYNLLYKAHFSLPDSRSKKSREEELYILDSTTIKLFSSVMKGAGTASRSGKKKGGAKAHVMMDSKHDLPAFICISEAKENDLLIYKHVQIPNGSTVVFDKAYTKYQEFISMEKRSIRWVTRLKIDTHVEMKEERMVDEESRNSGVMRDYFAIIGRPSNQHITPRVNVRVVDYHDTLEDRCFLFLTNDFERRPEEIAALYKKRWQIELLFKRLKQRYPLRYFLGDNPNAIKIQIWAALICDLLVKLIQKKVSLRTKRKWSYANISSMIKHHLMSYIKLIEFLVNPEIIFKSSQNSSLQLSLFKT
ncbi:MAG: IS4 family transposase [Saprospiraceae bacterium]|nr:IS4 family transposase [Saprospiraceae bacterium]